MDTTPLPAPSPEAVSLTCPACLAGREAACLVRASCSLYLLCCSMSLCTLGNEGSRGLAAWPFVCIQTIGTPKPNLLPCAKAPLKAILSKSLLPPSTSRHSDSLSHQVTLQWAAASEPG